MTDGAGLKNVQQPTFETSGLVLRPLAPSHAAAMLGHDRAVRKIEIGYWIGPPYWGCGYATEAAAAVVPFAFSHFGINKLVAKTSGGNLGSIKVLERLGMKQEGVLREQWFRDGEFRDVVCFGLLARERA